MENKYALLNYDMENNKSTPEFEKATKFLDDVLSEMVTGIKSEPINFQPSEVGYCFYGNLHWGSIGEKRTTGDKRVDDLIEVAVNKIKEFSNGPEDDGGIGDTMTDECIAEEVDRLMEAEPVMHDFLMNRK
jgi:hypothetical protein